MDIISVLTSILPGITSFIKQWKQPSTKNLATMQKELEARSTFQTALLSENLGNILDANYYMLEAYRLFSELNDVSNTYIAKQHLDTIRLAGEEMAATRRAAQIVVQQQPSVWDDTQRTLPLRLSRPH